MPKLGVFSGAEVCDILRNQGFEIVRQCGSLRCGAMINRIYAPHPGMMKTLAAEVVGWKSVKAAWWNFERLKR